jgi:hypothetical protein
MKRTRRVDFVRNVWLCRGLGRHECRGEDVLAYKCKDFPKWNKYNYFQSQHVSIGEQTSTPFENAFDDGDIKEQKKSHLVV